MIKIGDFSKLAHVTVKTLHHYGELGLLRPAHIDRYTGYRYYTLEQLSRLNRILALKDLGFSLDQVAQLVDDDLSVAEMRGMLRMKQIEIAEQLEREQSRLAQVEVRLRQLEGEGHSPKFEIALKQVDAQTVLTARAVAANDNAISPAKESLLALLQKNLQRARLRPVGPWFAIKDDLPYAETDQEVALAVPVSLRSGQRAGDWQGSPVTLEEFNPVECMASIIHTGGEVAISQAYAGLYTWAQANAYKIGRPCREIYLPETGISTNVESNLHSGFIEVQCPVERAKIPVSIYPSTEDRKEILMEPKYVTKPAMTMVGFSYVGKNENNEIPQLWGQWNARAAELKNRTGMCAYGACFTQVEGAGEGEFEYVAGMEVSDLADIPEGMVARQIPDYKFAVFTHKGKLHTLPETYKFIYETWLPQADVELHPDKFDMELYDDRFVLDSDESEFDILVAVK